MRRTFFVRLSGAGGLVVDCRPADRVEPADRVDARSGRRRSPQWDGPARQPAGSAGWSMRLIQFRSSTYAGWLPAQPLQRRASDVGSGVLGVLEPGAAVAQAAEAGDPMAVLPVVFWGIR